MLWLLTLFLSFSSTWWPFFLSSGGGIALQCGSLSVHRIDVSHNAAVDGGGLSVQSCQYSDRLVDITNFRIQ